MSVRICNVITRMIVGGPQQVSLLAGEYYRDQPGFEYHLVSGTETGAEGDYLREMRDHGIVWHPIPDLVRELRPAADVRALSALVRLFRRLRPDLVHARSAKARLLGPLAARTAGVPVVVQTVHGWSFNNAVDSRKPLFVQLEKASRVLCDYSVFVSTEDLDTGSGLGILGPDAVARNRAGVIRSPVDLAAFERLSGAARAAFRADLGVEGSTSVVSLVQRLSEPKTPLVFVEAMRAVVRRHPGVAIWIVGDGKLREPTERAVGEAGLAPRTRFLGVRKDIAALLSASDVVVHSSIREGLPRVVLETLNVGTPLVATAVGGVPEVVKDGENGLLVPPSNAHALATAIVAALDDPSGAKLRSEQGRRAVLAFSAPRALGEQHALYERLLRARGILDGSGGVSGGAM
jgi:glycosyltransferase involved in cell wall biosynthesis